MPGSFLPKIEAVIAMPTGSGKSTCIMALGLSDLLKGRADMLWVTSRNWVVVPRN